MNVNDLNVYCLRQLFSKFRLQEQIQLRIVCTQWCDLIEEELRRRKELKVFGSISKHLFQLECSYNTIDIPAEMFDVRLSDDNYIVLCPSPGVETNIADFLCRLFPKIEKLLYFPGYRFKDNAHDEEKFFDDQDVVPKGLPQVATLLLGWRSTMTTLVLERADVTMWSTLAQISTLKNLYIHDGLAAFGSHQVSWLAPGQYATLNRLEYFRTGVMIYTWFICFGPNLKRLHLPELMLGYLFRPVYFEASFWDYLPLVKARNLTHLSFACSRTDTSRKSHFFITNQVYAEETLRLLCATFPSLQSLKLPFHIMSAIFLYDFTRMLASLNTLTELVLSFEFIFRHPHSEPVIFYYGVSRVPVDNFLPMYPVKSVRVLRFNDWRETRLTDEQLDHFARSLSRGFPNLERIVARPESIVSFTQVATRMGVEIGTYN